MKSKGFTLVEMVMTIVVMGIVFLGLAGFLELGTKGYVDSVDRQKIQNQARFVIEKLSREIRHAVPNSFAVVTNTTSKCLNFYPIKNAGFYRLDEQNRHLEFIVDNQGSRLTDSASDRLVTNPSQISDLTSDSHSVSLAGCLSSSDSSCVESEPGSGVYTYTVSDVFSSHSVAKRHYTYNGQVSYCITSAGLITRNGVNVGEGLDLAQSSFSYLPATLQRGGLIHLDFLFTNQDEQSFYKHDVQVLNVP